VIFTQSERHVTWVRQSKVNIYGSPSVVLPNKLHSISKFRREMNIVIFLLGDSPAGGGVGGGGGGGGGGGVGGGGGGGGAVVVVTYIQHCLQYAETPIYL
jgi:hypothetical protein